MERAYDFQELVGCANTVNQLAAIEYGENGLRFDRAHNKQQNIWAKLHPLQPGEAPADLGDYSSLTTDADIVLALKEGLKAAQATLKSLNMAPSSCAKKKTWFAEPWLVERADPKHWTYVPPARPVPGEDGDAEVLREALAVQTEAACSASEGDDGVADDGGLHSLSEDEGDVLRVAEEECRHAISEMLDEAEPRQPGMSDCESSNLKIMPVVQYNGQTIYKSTLVADLNGNPFLSKDRLTRIKNSVYFNNADDYLSAANSSTTALLGLGSDCGVYFVQSASLNQSSAVKAAQKRSRSCGQVGRPTAVSSGAEIGTWWLGRVQKIRRSFGSKWGPCRNPIDLMSQGGLGKKVSSKPEYQVMLNWFKSAPGRNKFKYEVTDTQWIDVDSIICIVALSFNSTSNVYTLDENDRNVLDEFVSKNS